MLDALESPGETSGEFDRCELAAVLDALPDDGWIIDETLSVSPFETTQLVHRSKGKLDNKFIRKVFARDTNLGAAYERVFAAQAAGAQFDHLPLIYDMVETGEGMAVVMQFVQGETLQRYIERGNHGVELGIQVGLQLCDAMTELHESFGAPIVHRDLKPGNIMMANGKLMIIDLGIARTWRAGAPHDTVRLGTPGYAPPEQFGYGQTSPQSDLYAAGMVVAFCIIGTHPTGDLRESGFSDPRIPASLRTVLAKATALDPSQRFKSAHDMKEALDEAARQCRSPQPSAPWAKGEYGAHDELANVNCNEPRIYDADNPLLLSSVQDEQESVEQTVQFPGQRNPLPQDKRRPADESGNRSRLPFRIPHGIGVAWNVLLGLLWAFLFFVSMDVAIEARTEFLDPLPIWFRIAMYLGFVVLPTTAVAILLADKRRLRNRFPVLGRYSWPKMALACIAFVAICMIATLLAYGILFSS